MKIAVTTLAFCVAALLALGMVILYSSSMTQTGTRYLFMQLIWCSLGLILCVTVASNDYHHLQKFAWPIFGLALLLLVLLLVMRDHSIAGLSTPRINGARRWFDFHGVRFQPSELAKLALIVVLAWYGERCQRQMDTWVRGIVLPGLIISVLLGLIFIQPDRGTTILLAAVSGAMLLIAGVKMKYIIPPFLLAAAALGISLFHDPVRAKRIFSWINLEESKSGTGYQAYQAMLALGSGGWTGLGLGNGRQKLGFLPEHRTDFIFAVIGEELGLIATLLVVLAFVVIVACGVMIAARARDKFGFLLGVGVTFLIGLQAFINIGVVTSALPNKGLSLPFISYGGSNMLTMLVCVGVIISIARQSRQRESTMVFPGRAADFSPAQIT